MKSSTHNPTPPRRRVPPPPALPQEFDPIEPNELVPGDDITAFTKLREQTHAFANHPSGFPAVLTDILVGQCWEFYRNAAFRNTAMRIQIEYNEEKLQREFLEPGDDLRQYLAWKSLAEQPAFRELIHDSDRLFRRLRQAQDALLKATMPKASSRRP